MKATTIRKNHIVRVEGNLYRVLNMDHVTPGKGRAHVQTKLRNLIDGTQTEVRFRSDDDVEQVSLETRTMQYLYSDGEGYHFMDTASYDQVQLQEAALGDAKAYLVADQELQIQWFEGTPVNVDMPLVVELTVVETTPVVKGATASAQRKPAKLETGAVVQVPAFIEEGEKIRVNTAEGTYIERVT